MKLIWHYTNGQNIDAILKDGVIQLATAGIQPPEKPGAHFSTNPVWEPSANRGNVTLKKGDYPVGQAFDADPIKDFKVSKFDPVWMDKHMGRYRIGVIPEAAPHGWRTFCKLASVPNEIRVAMERANKKENGDPDQWRHSLQPVPRKFWRTVEKLEHGIWATYVDLGFVVQGESSEGGRWGRS